MITMPMNGRCALVTGASKGIGFAIARNFAMAGAHVALVARDAATLEAAKVEITNDAPGAKLVVVSADVATAEGCAHAFDKAQRELGQIDVLVNNADISAAKSFVEVTDAEWQAYLDLKLFAAIRLCRLALPEMSEWRWGRIINILNTGAKAPRAGSTPTSVSRAAGQFPLQPPDIGLPLIADRSSRVRELLLTLVKRVLAHPQPLRNLCNRMAPLVDLRHSVPLEILAETALAHHALLASNLGKKASTNLGAIHCRGCPNVRR